MQKIPLREIAKAANPRRRVLRLRPIDPTASQERDLAAIYVRAPAVWRKGSPAIVAQYGAEMMRVSDGMVRDDVGFISAVIALIAGDAEADETYWQQLFTAWANSMSQWHMQRIISDLKYNADIDISTMISTGDTAETVDIFVARNMALIRDVSDQTRAKISDIVMRGMSNQVNTRLVAKEISEAVGLSRKRSLRIAADQTNKLSAALDRNRLVQLGFDGIIWRHSHKRNFRPEHKARDGKFFKWDSVVMRTDPPGFQPFCGCHSTGEMDLTDGE